MSGLKRNQRKRLQKKSQAGLTQLLAEFPWEDWDEDKTQLKSVLGLNATTYKPVPILNVPASSRPSNDYLLSPQGNFAYRNEILPAYCPLEHFEHSGVTIWNGPIVLPMLLDMNRQAVSGKRFSVSSSESHRANHGAVWMSLTPAEMLSQRSGIQRAKEKVLIGGLGLGWFLRKVCEQECVNEVVVIERSQELLDWYGNDLCKKQPKVKEVICNDVYAEVEKFPDHQLLLDIWPTYQGPDGAASDQRLAHLRTQVGDRLWAWGLN